MKASTSALLLLGGLIVLPSVGDAYNALTITIDTDALNCPGGGQADVNFTYYTVDAETGFVQTGGFTLWAGTHTATIAVGAGDTISFTATNSCGVTETCTPASAASGGRPAPGAQGTAPISVEVGGSGASGTATNSSTNACLTLNNSTDQVQYYTFQSQLLTAGSTTTTPMSGCSGGLTVNGESGPNENTPGQYLAVYPGESITVCSTLTAASGGSMGVGNTIALFTAMLAPSDGSVYPCGVVVGTPRCVNLCANSSDGGEGPYLGGNDAAVAGATWNPSAGGYSSSSGTNGSGVFSGTGSAPTNFPTTNANGGTNGLLIPTLVAGFDNVVTAVNENGLDAANDANAIMGNAYTNRVALQGTLSNGFAGLSNALGASNLLGTNLGALTNLNYLTNSPTNYPDAAAIRWLGIIASNTSNPFDTNLEASASAIASNTAAPLAYTNLGLGAYSTNPSDIVGYASNTLAGPVNQSMQGYAQSASSAGAGVNIGGSPGGLLVINFDIPGIGAYSIDCNPMDNTDVADFANWFRNVMEWLVGVGFVGMVLRDGTQATRTTLLTPQGQFPKLTVLGNSIGWPLAAVYIVAIVAAMAAVPFAIVTWFSVGSTGQMWWQQIAVNPFSGQGVGPAVSLSLWLADQFFPMSYIVSSTLYYIAFRFTLNGIVMVAATIVRALMA